MKKNKYILKEARYIMSIDWRVRSDLALGGEFYLKYGVTPADYIKEFGSEEEKKKLPGYGYEKNNVFWQDAEFVEHSFEMEVSKNESKLNIDHLVMDEIFDRAVDCYSWN